MGELIDNDICLASGCPFVCKDNNTSLGDPNLIKGVCLKAYVSKQGRRKVCDATVIIRKAKKNGR